VEEAADPVSRIAPESPPAAAGGKIARSVGRTGVRPDTTRERARLELRRSLVGQVVRLTPEWRDALNPDNPFALDPSWSWLETAAGAWELRMFNYGMILEDAILRSYSEPFLLRLAWVVETLTPLMREERLEIPAWYERRSRLALHKPERRKLVAAAGGLRSGDSAKKLTLITASWEPGGPVDGRNVGQSIALTGHSQHDTALLYSALHELAHAIRSDDPLELADERLAEHSSDAGELAFRRRYGRLLQRMLDEDSSLTRGQQRWLRSWAVEDALSSPIPPEPRRSWSFDAAGRYLVLPHPVDDPPNWWDLEER
jgi:hypothetical protein